MKRLFKWWLMFSFLILFSICVPGIAHAQVDGGCDPGDPGCPIDGGLTALLAVGAAYGIKKIRDSKQA